MNYLRCTFTHYCLRPHRLFSNAFPTHCSWPLPCRRPFHSSVPFQRQDPLVQRLALEAQRSPMDAGKQAEYLQELLQSRRPHQLIEYFESNRSVHFDADCARLYVEALNETGQAEKALKFVVDGVRQAPLKSTKTKTRSYMPTAPSQPSPSFQKSRLNSSHRSADLSVQTVGAGSVESPLHVITRPAPLSHRDKFWMALKFTFGLWALVAVYTIYSEEIGRLQGRNFSVFNEIDPTAAVDGQVYKFEDVQGVDEAKEELQEIVEFLKDPAKFTRLGGKLPKGVLLTGPPGTGKTLLARAIAGEAGVPFIHCSGSEFDEMFVGVGAKRVRELFSAAKKRSPCIIFIDEIDAVGGMRNPRDQQFAKMTLNQLLVEMDGFNQNQGIIVIGATNFPESLDKALIRPGRFDRSVIVSVPDVKGRLDILKVHTRKVPLQPDVKLEVLARATPGFSGADLANLINHAALKAAALNLNAVGMKEMEWAIDRIVMGAEKKNSVMSPKNRKLVAYHEAGHAIVGLFTPGSMPIHKATIMPRGSALGMVSRLPEDDLLLESRKKLLADLDIAMGGRCAEELIFGKEEITSGASSDIAAASQQARNMVTRYGMGSQAVGHVLFEGHKYEQYSSQTRQAIEEDVRKLIDEAHVRAMNLLKTHRVELERLALALLEYETLNKDEIDVVVKGGHPNRDPLDESAHTMDKRQRTLVSS